ncbi:9767_t:CDS:1 [Paraglomus occultum]|uniref:9767_t:CDS:1 n=1 Tax=Paraglomus occultum TaxID=144539 RepID=A0A9N8ZE29_9GLOM|nr:9767_t:CDS:1 [Paraglomus occultum]
MCSKKDSSLPPSATTTPLASPSNAVEMLFFQTDESKPDRLPIPILDSQSILSTPDIRMVASPPVFLPSKLAWWPSPPPSQRLQQHPSPLLSPNQPSFSSPTTSPPPSPRLSPPTQRQTVPTSTDNHVHSNEFMDFLLFQ